jgi:hypothetical protein
MPSGPNSRWHGKSATQVSKPSVDHAVDGAHGGHHPTDLACRRVYLFDAMATDWHDYAGIVQCTLRAIEHPGMPRLPWTGPIEVVGLRRTLKVSPAQRSAGRVLVVTMPGGMELVSFEALKNAGRNLQKP